MMQQLKIGVIGLGLIGGSFCKAIKTKTRHTCLGFDLDGETCKKALEAGAIDAFLPLPEGLREGLDLVIVCLHPRQTIRFLTSHAGDFSPETLVIDSCGVKQRILDDALPALQAAGVPFIGAHPMAGREFSGFDYSLPGLYEGASLILTPPVGTDPVHLELISALAAELGFGRVVTTTPARHDATIAFTSQLAHVLSNAYVKSPTLWNQSGFSAGSFQDLSRVAKLDEQMWTDLFLMNRDALLAELNTVIGNLQQYADALANEDADTLKSLLRDGSSRKQAQLAL